MTDDELIDMAHTIFLRMAVWGGFDSYTGVRLLKWLRIYDSRPTKRPADASAVDVFIHVQKCPHCGGEINIPEVRR